MTAYKSNNKSRVYQGFNYDGLSCGTALVYFQGREGQHVVYEESFGEKELLMRFTTIEDARVYWKKLRANLESKGYTSGKVERVGK